MPARYAASTSARRSPSAPCRAIAARREVAAMQISRLLANTRSADGSGTGAGAPPRRPERGARCARSALGGRCIGVGLLRIAAVCAPREPRRNPDRHVFAQELRIENERRGCGVFPRGVGDRFRSERIQHRHHQNRSERVSASGTSRLSAFECWGHSRAGCSRTEQVPDQTQCRPNGRYLAPFGSRRRAARTRGIAHGRIYNAHQCAGRPVVDWAQEKRVG